MSAVTTEAAEKTFQVVFECQAVNKGSMRNDINVKMIEPEHMEYDLATDEGAFHGGAASAPPPLALFGAAFAGCIMTQLRAFSKRLRIDAGEIRVGLKLHWQGKQKGREPYVGEPVGFSFDIELTGNATDEEKTRLVEAAKKGCFLDQTLARPNAVGHRLKTASGWVEV